MPCAIQKTMLLSFFANRSKQPFHLIPLYHIIPTFDNIVGKEEITCNQHFVLLQQCFLLFHTCFTVSHIYFVIC